MIVALPVPFVTDHTTTGSLALLGLIDADSLRGVERGMVVVARGFEMEIEVIFWYLWGWWEGEEVGEEE